MYITCFEFKSCNLLQLFIHLFHALTFALLPEYDIMHVAFMSLMFMFVTIQMLLLLLTGIFHYFHELLRSPIHYSILFSFSRVKPSTVNRLSSLSKVWFHWNSVLTCHLHLQMHSFMSSSWAFNSSLLSSEPWVLSWKL